MDQAFVGTSASFKSTNSTSSASADPSGAQEVLTSAKAGEPLLRVLLLPNFVVRRFFCNKNSQKATLYVLHCRDVKMKIPRQQTGALAAALSGAELTAPPSPPSSSSSSPSSWSMTQGDSAQDKGYGEKLLGVWMLAPHWNAAPFPAAVSAAASPDNGSTYYSITPWMRLRQSSREGARELDGAFAAWLRSAVMNPEAAEAESS